MTHRTTFVVTCQIRNIPNSNRSKSHKVFPLPFICFGKTALLKTTDGHLVHKMARPSDRNPWSEVVWCIRIYIYIIHGFKLFNGTVYSTIHYSSIFLTFWVKFWNWLISIDSSTHCDDTRSVQQSLVLISLFSFGHMTVEQRRSVVHITPENRWKQ